MQNAKGHRLEQNVTAPTCTNIGYTTVTCKDCVRTAVPNMVGHFPEVPNITIAAFPAGVCGIALLGAAGSGYLLGIVMPQCVYIIALITLVTVNAGVFGIAHFSAVGHYGIYLHSLRRY